MTVCSWCGHPEHKAGAACPRKIATRRYVRGTPPTDVTVACPCRRPA